VCFAVLFAVIILQGIAIAGGIIKLGIPI